METLNDLARDKDDHRSLGCLSKEEALRVYGRVWDCLDELGAYADFPRANDRNTLPQEDVPDSYFIAKEDGLTHVEIIYDVRQDVRRDLGTEKNNQLTVAGTGDEEILASIFDQLRLEKTE